MIKAAQHLYGNVEREYSPGGVGGFQTLFYTRGLLAHEEAEEIEVHDVIRLQKEVLDDIKSYLSVR